MGSIFIFVSYIKYIIIQTLFHKTYIQFLIFDIQPKIFEYIRIFAMLYEGGSDYSLSEGGAEHCDEDQECQREDGDYR